MTEYASFHMSDVKFGMGKKTQTGTADIYFSGLHKRYNSKGPGERRTRECHKT